MRQVPAAVRRLVLLPFSKGTSPSSHTHACDTTPLRKTAKAPATMKTDPDRSGTLHLTVQSTGRPDRPACIHAAPPYLPDAVWPLPGESMEHLAHRAMQMAVGSGAVLVSVLYPVEARQ